MESDIILQIPSDNLLWIDYCEMIPFKNDGSYFLFKDYLELRKEELGFVCVCLAENRYKVIDEHKLMLSRIKYGM